MKEERKHYLDSIRSMTVILVMLYHSAYVFNGVGVLGGFTGTEGFWLTDGLCTLVYPWFMVLMFCISGIAARHSIEKRGVKRFFSERVAKLLVPSTLGLFVFHWISGIINIKIGGGLETIPPPLLYPIAVLSGTGPLWFAQVLFIYSLSCKFLVKLNGGRFDKMCQKMNSLTILLLAFVIWGGAQILNMPIIVVYRLGIYFVAFLIGYFVLYHNDIITKVEKMLPLTLALSIVLGTIYMTSYLGSDYTQDKVLKSSITNIYLWTSILAILALGKKFLNRSDGIWQYLRYNSFNLYVLHYLPIIVIGYLFRYYTTLPSGLCIVFTFIFDLALTPLISFIIAKIPIVRYCVLGIRERKNEIQTDN